jgi:16S rRNA (uracil1498-N3)-methyltransferase
MPRFYCPTPLSSDALLDLPSGAARHAQVLRLQPGSAVTLFNGLADANGLYGEYHASITQMGRSHVQVQVGQWLATRCDPLRKLHLAVGMPANERMDWLVEKATELGVTSIQPLMCERSVLRLSGERAVKKQAHWQSVAIAACEQCGGNRVPLIHPVLTLPEWLLSAPTMQSQRAVLSLQTTAVTLRNWAQFDAADALSCLSGPEGGLSPSEELAAVAAGFTRVSLGQRVLRAETAALAVAMLGTL